MAAVAGAICATALAVVVLLATSAGGSNGSYHVRAIFDDAGNLTSGENVKIDGVNVGTVGSVTPRMRRWFCQSLGKAVCSNCTRSAARRSRCCEGVVVLISELRHARP